MSVKVYNYTRQGSVGDKIRICICVRTSARILQHADEDNKEQDPKTGRQTDTFQGLRLCVSVFGLCVRACVRAAACLRKFMNVCVNTSDTS